jgi:hypothetical protein
VNDAALDGVLCFSRHDDRRPDCGADGDTKAAALIKQARAALGGDSKLAKIQGLSAAGTLAREMGDRQVTGEVTIDVQLPDKMVRTDSMSPMGDATIVLMSGVNGETLIRNSKTLNAGPGLMVRMPAPPAAGSDAETQALRAARADLARFAIAFLLTPPASMPLEFTDGGEAESPDGKADVVNVKRARQLRRAPLHRQELASAVDALVPGRRAADGDADDEGRPGARPRDCTAPRQ